MSLILIKETGSALPNSNSYASATDADAYHEGHLYPSAWTGASTATKQAALVMATRLIDAAYQFNGSKVLTTQALQWPRQMALDPDVPNPGALGIAGLLDISSPAYFDRTQIPQALVDATCELARELIKSDTTDATDGEGISSIGITGGLHIQFDKKDQQPKIPETARLFLAKLGTYLASRSGTVKLIRV
jgi:hypothetical protein